MRLEALEYKYHLHNVTKATLAVKHIINWAEIYVFHH